MKILERIFSNSISDKDFINKLRTAGYEVEHNELLDVYNNNCGYVSFSKELEYFNWMDREEWLKAQQIAKEKAAQSYYKIGSECKPSSWILRQKGLPESVECTIIGQTDKALKVKVYEIHTEKYFTEWFPKTQVTVAGGDMIARGKNAKIDRAVGQAQQLNTEISQLTEKKRALEKDLKFGTGKPMSMAERRRTEAKLKEAKEKLADYHSRPKDHLAKQKDIQSAEYDIRECEERFQRDVKAKKIADEIARIEAEISKKKHQSERLEAVLRNI